MLCSFGAQLSSCFGCCIGNGMDLRDSTGAGSLYSNLAKGIVAPMCTQIHRSLHCMRQHCAF
jgi:hypothetical protein